MKAKFLLTEVWCKIALLFLFGGFYAAAIPFPEKARQFPQLIALVSFAMTVIALALDFLRPQDMAQAEISGVEDTELAVLDAATRRMRRSRYYKAWAVIIASTVVGVLGGFLFCAIGLFGGFVILFTAPEQRRRNAVIGGITTVVVYLVFGLVMKVPMLGGILW